jgi:hypothetical protein
VKQSLKVTNNHGGQLETTEGYRARLKAKGMKKITAKDYIESVFWNLE